MCTNFVPSTRQELAAQYLGLLELPHEDWPDEVFPGYLAPILLRAAVAGAGVHADAGGDAGQPLQCRLARFGLVPRWCKNDAQARDISRKTYNARSETALEKPSFREPWAARQWALAPMRSFFEPCWEAPEGQSARAVRWQIGLAEQSHFAVAGLWERWEHAADGVVRDSFTLLTVNADGHALMGRMHKAGEEKRMPVIIPAQHYAAWLNATAQTACDWMRNWPAEQMRGQPAPRAAMASFLPPAAPGHTLSLF
jgi:putative SOS response-associated peptidase YedK